MATKRRTKKPPCSQETRDLHSQALKHYHEQRKLQGDRIPDSATPMQDAYSYYRSLHGNTQKGRTRLYAQWVAIHRGQKVSSPHHRYVECCPEWHKNFPAFCDWSLQNGYNPDPSESLHCILWLHPDAVIYSPDTCKWIRVPDTVTNPTASRSYGAYKDVTLPLTEWAFLLGISAKFLQRKFRESKGDFEVAAIEATKPRPRYKKRTIRSIEEAYNLYKSNTTSPPE